MSKSLIVSWRGEVLLVDFVHPVLLPDILVDKDGGEVMIVPAHIPADGGFGPGFFPFRIIGESQEEPEDGDEVDDA